MQIYLLRQSELRMMTLPERVSGHFVLDYTDAAGNTVPLVHIDARDDKWYIAENPGVRIEGRGAAAGEFREFCLVENTLYYLRTEQNENMILMVEPENNSRSRYRLYRIPAGGIIDVGQAEYNQVQFRHRYVEPNRHLRIRYRDDLPEAVVTAGEGIGSASANPVYLNNQIVKDTAAAGIGDVVFLFGLKIVLGRGFIAVNDPDAMTRISLEPKPMSIFLPQQIRERDAEDDTFSSAPRERKEFIRQTLKIDQPPEGLQESDTPWFVMLGPSLTMAMGSLFSSVLTINNVMASGGGISGAMPSLVTSLVMVMGSAVWPVVARRIQHRSQVRKAAIAAGDYEIHLQGLKAQIQSASELQKKIQEENNPVLDHCIRNIMHVSEALWERSQRHKDFLDVMIGRGDVPLEVDFVYPERGYHSQISQCAKDMYDLVDREHIVENVPITLPLKDAGIVGVIGDRDQVISFGKALLIELTAMHNYEDLKIIFIYDEKERRHWNFVKWIPHLWNDEQTVRYLANDADEVRSLSDYIGNLRAVQRHGGKEQSGPHYLIFAADRNLAERAQAIKEFYQSPDADNMTIIALYNERRYLPKACSYVIDLISSAERAKAPDKYVGVKATLADYNDITGQRIRCRERIGFDGDPEEIFIQMSNIRLNSVAAAKQLPRQITFMEMFEMGRAEHMDLLRRWRENSSVNSLAAPIGIDADGYRINLDIHEKRQGPHGVIGGMTGSGKSEFIISMIASLAINYSPEDVAFVLIDFKGGGMADVFRQLPHTAGLITNLDGNELKRSFLAIENELEKRQKLFKEISERKKISNIDINKYQKLRREDRSLRPLPHLVLISDEFAELKQQHGDFMGQLIRIARIGRSLGVHLILATQKPDGVVDDQIKSNIRFKICLKVQDKSDSQGLIGRPDATLITDPGRFYMQVGNDEVFEYGQSPWSGATYEPTEHPRRNVCDYIEVINEQGRPICRQAMAKGPRPAGIPEKQIDAIVQFIRQVAEQNGLRAEKLWLDPLPGPRDEKKDSVYDTSIKAFVLNPVVGKYDDLVNQKHLDLTIPFTLQGNALLYGAAGSGKLEFLNKMLVSLMEHHTPEEVNFFLCDYDSGSLAAFEDAAHTKAYVGACDRAGTARMLDTLLYELTERRSRMRRFGGDYQTYVRTSGTTVPNLLLVVHNFQNLTESDPEARQKISQLAREGVKYGIFLIVTGTSANSIPYALQPLFKNIYTLRQNADEQYREILGKTGGIVPDRFKGRGLVKADGSVCEFQTGMVFEDADNVYEAIRRFCAEMADKWAAEDSGAGQTPADQAAPAREQVFIPEAVPIARSGEEEICWDLTASAVTLVCHDDLHARQRAGVLEAFCRAMPADGRIIRLGSDPARITAAVDELWDLMKRRGAAGMAAKQAGQPMPQFPPVLVMVEEPGMVTDVAAEADRVRLVAMIRQLTPAYRIWFVLDVNHCHLTQLVQERCLNRLFPLDRGILLTAQKGARILFPEETVFSGRADIPYGYIIGGGSARLAEMNEI